MAQARSRIPPMRNTKLFVKHMLNFTFVQVKFSWSIKLEMVMWLASY